MVEINEWLMYGGIMFSVFSLGAGFLIRSHEEQPSSDHFLDCSIFYTSCCLLKTVKHDSVIENFVFLTWSKMRGDGVPYQSCHKMPQFEEDKY